jgi:hypothetical protein
MVRGHGPGRVYLIAALPNADVQSYLVVIISERYLDTCRLPPHYLRLCGGWQRGLVGARPFIHAARRYTHRSFLITLGDYPDSRILASTAHREF